MSASWESQLGEWIEKHGQIAFDLPVDYKADGSRNMASCRRVLTKYIEPLFREAGVCWLFGTKISDASFGGAGKAVGQLLNVRKGRKSMAYATGVMTRFATFFANERSDDRMLRDQRGTVVFSVEGGSPALRGLARALPETEIVRNYPTTMDRAGLTFAQEAVREDGSRAIVCLPGRMGLDTLYVFAQPLVLRDLLKGHNPNP